jgi:hypothetical protein
LGKYIIFREGGISVNDKKSSYIGQLSSGYESDTVKEYDPAVEQGQIGLAETEKVTTEKNWGHDQRLPMGIGVMSVQDALIKLRKVARTLALMENEYKNANNKQASVNPMESVVHSQTSQNGDLLRIATSIQEIGTNLIDLVKTATINHPEEKPSVPTWLEESSAQTGDEQWIDIGPAHFADPRDAVGRATA